MKIVRFKLKPHTFWKNADFPRVERAALYPNQGDPLFALAQSIKHRLNGNG